MTREQAVSKRDAAVNNFLIEGEVLTCERYGHGHINDTFLLTTTEKRYILQRINHTVFLEPEKLMENICSVTGFLREKVIAKGGDPLRECLTVVNTKDGVPYYRDAIGCYWRLYLFIEGSYSNDKVSTPHDFYLNGLAFGQFQNLLADYPAKTLHETIPNFHNTPQRYCQLQTAIENAEKRLLEAVKPELDFIGARVDDMSAVTNLLSGGEIPLRVTHNDTKLNNILMDGESGRGICVIDLDTVMPGVSVFDYGDAIRFGANTAVEDERDLSKVSLDLALFEAFTRGFLEGCGDSLTRTEVDMLVMGAKLMTLECGMRFLIDHLNGDVYFKVSREGHNLDRCRTQLALVLDMERKWEQMLEIVDRYR